MPYINKELRIPLDYYSLSAPQKLSAGELNYLITKIALSQVSGPSSYNDINEIIGVLECVKQELYRRLAAPHEDKKIQENGDVY